MALHQTLVPRESLAIAPERILSMKRPICYLLNVFIVFALLLATDRRAWAYVDPGSGLFALQGFASVAAAVGYFLRRKILALFGRGKTSPKTSSSPDSPHRPA